MPGGRQAALATLVVVNHTALRLAISFRYAIEPGGDIEVGAVEPGDTATMAPVPAGEPILLTARGENFERRLEPRTLEIDEVMTWTVREEPNGER